MLEQWQGAPAWRCNDQACQLVSAHVGQGDNTTTHPLFNDVRVTICPRQQLCNLLIKLGILFQGPASSPSSIDDDGQQTIAAIPLLLSN